MKKNLLFIGILVVPVYLIISSYGGDSTALYPGGAPAGYTGSPGDGKNCTHCHNGTAVPVTGWITSDVGPNGYELNHTYTITVTLTGNGAKGFEVSPQTLTGSLIGTLTAGSGCKLCGSEKYVTHSSASNASTQVWSFNWTSPSTNTGDVTFYGAFTVGKPNTKLSTLVIPEDLTTGIDDQEKSVFSFYPNPVRENLTLDYYIPESTNLRVELYNITGQRVAVLMDQQENSGNHSNTVSLPGDVREGIYILKYIYGDKVDVKKLIVQ